MKPAIKIDSKYLSEHQVQSALRSLSDTLDVLTDLALTLKENDAQPELVSGFIRQLGIARTDCVDLVHTFRAHTKSGTPRANNPLKSNTYSKALKLASIGV